MKAAEVQMTGQMEKPIGVTPAPTTCCDLDRTEQQQKNIDMKPIYPNPQATGHTSGITPADEIKRYIYMATNWLATKPVPQLLHSNTATGLCVINQNTSNGHTPGAEKMKKAWLIMSLVLLMFLPGIVRGQISSLQNWTNLYHGTSENAQNITYAIPAGTNTYRVLVVAIASSRIGAGSAGVTLTYGGQTPSSSVGDMSSNTIQHTQLYYFNEAKLDAASNTTLSVTVSYSGGSPSNTDVFATVFDDVDQTSPILNSQTYNSSTAAVDPFQFATGLTVNAKDQAIEIIGIVRTGSTTQRTIDNYATNWTSGAAEQTATYDVGGTSSDQAIRNAVANRAIPTTTVTDVSSTNLSGSALASMTAFSLKAYIYPVPTISSFSPNSACSGDVASVTITGNNFTGATVVSLNGTAATSYTVTNATTISATFPETISTGKISVTAPGGTVQSTDDFNVLSVPATPGVITGSTTACAGASLTYSVAPVSGATSYEWTVPTGWNITAGQGTTTITVTAGSAGQNGNITVAASNTCGSSSASTTIDIVPANATNNTGYIQNTNTKNSGGIQCSANNFGTERRGFIKFPLTSIPANASVTSSVLTLTNNGSGTLSGTNNDIKPLGNNDPTSAGASTLWNAIGTQGSGTNYSSTTWNNTGAISLTLNSTANSDIESRISSPAYIAMGLARGGTSNYIFNGYADGANAPKLTVNYTVPPSSLAVMVNAIPTTSFISQNDITCFNGTNGEITISVSGGTSPYTFSKNNGDDNYTQPFTFVSPNYKLTGLPAGTYQIRVKDANHCESTINP